MTEFLFSPADKPHFSFLLKGKNSARCMLGIYLNV